jgi:hypothetical protein
MADRMLFISWGAPVPGREERGLEVFNEAVGMYGRMQQDGRIESFDVCLLGPNAKIDGYIAVHGSADQLNAIREDDEYLRNMMDAGLIVADLAVVEGYTGEGVARMMGIYQEAIGRVPQAA